MSIEGAFIQLLKNAGYTPRKYSGRGMMGRECIAFVPDDGDNPMTIGWNIACAFHDAGDELLAWLSDIQEYISSYKQDNLGFSTIYYFPDMEWVEEASADPEDLEN